MTCRWSSWYKLQYRYMYFWISKLSVQDKKLLNVFLCLVLFGRSLGFVHFFTGKYAIETDYTSFYSDQFEIHCMGFTGNMYMNIVCVWGGEVNVPHLIKINYLYRYRVVPALWAPTWWTAWCWKVTRSRWWTTSSLGESAM